MLERGLFGQGGSLAYRVSCQTAVWEKPHIDCILNRMERTAKGERELPDKDGTYQPRRAEGAFLHVSLGYNVIFLQGPRPETVPSDSVDSVNGDAWQHDVASAAIGQGYLHAAVHRVIRDVPHSRK